MGGVLLIAIVLRVIVVVYLGNEVVELPGIHDQISYDTLAQRLLSGNGYSFPDNWYPFTPADTPTAHWSFIYPLYLAGIYAIVGYYPVVARLIQAIAGGLLVCWLIFDIGKRVNGESAAMIGAGIAAVYGYFIYYSAALMTETFFIIATLFALQLILKQRESPTVVRWLWIGVAFGVGSLLRQTMLFVFPVAFIWLFIELRGRVRIWEWALSAVVMILVILPATVRNQLVYGEFLLLNSNSGYALFAASHPRLGSQWRNEDIVAPIPEEFNGLNEAELNTALTKEAIQFVLQDPVRYFELTLSKSLELIKFWPSSSSSLVSNLVRTFSFGLLLPLIIVGLYLSFSRWRNYSYIYLFSISHIGLHLLSWPAPRYRLTADALLMPVAGLAVYELIKFMHPLVRKLHRTDPQPTGFE